MNCGEVAGEDPPAAPAVGLAPPPPPPPLPVPPPPPAAAAAASDLNIVSHCKLINHILVNQIN